ncbi:MAG: carboxypeptidase regulatory-like domain-containing protein [Terriglobia bacterium]
MNSRSGPLRFRVGRAAGLVIPALLLAYLSGWAGPGGSISGRVLDPSDAVIPGATIVISNVETGVRQTTASNSDGFYSLSALPPGQYQIEARQSGFRPTVQSGLILETDKALEVDLKLELGQQSTAVTVTESGLRVDTADTTMGETITTSKMASVPLNGRSFTDLLALQPGVVPASSQQPNAVVMSGCTRTAPSGDLNAGNLSVSGQRETSNGFVVNGSNVEEDFSMGTALVPNLDSIQEFRVLTSNFDAEYGNYSGGQIVVTTKSGTNEFHGSGFDFLRNTNLDARNYFSPDRARYDQSQFGGTFGGPIKREKSFFFIDYQGTRMTEGMETGLISVPALPERTGDLSSIASSLTGAVNGQSWANSLSESLGYPVFPGEAYYTPGCASSAECVLPKAQIPLTAWSGPARSLLPFIPFPNQGANTFSTSAYNQTLRDDKAAIRIDTHTGLGTLAAYYFFDDYGLNNPYPTAQGGASVPGFNAITLGRAQMASLGLTKVFGPTMVNELHLSYLRDANNVGQPQGGVGPGLASQGFVDGSGNPSIYALAPQIEGIENVSFNDFTLGVDTTGLKEANNTFQVSEDFSKVMGPHTLKLGAGFHIDQVNINPDATFNGAFSFTGAETGSDFADFLLGIPSSYAQGDSLAFYLRDKYVGMYAQDSWRARPSLTLNYGLRWDVLPAWREKYNQLQTLVLGEQSRVYPGAPQGLVFPGDPGIPATLAPTKYTNFAPRFGLAYSPDYQSGWLGKVLGGRGSTSVRAGYGLYYTAFEGLSAGIMSANPPYGYDYTSLAPPLFSNPFVTAASGQNVGQRFPEPIPAFGASAANPNSSVDWSPYLPITGVPSFYYQNVPPYSASYTLSLERQIAPNTLLSLTYAGSQAHHLLVLISANPGNPAECLSVSQTSQVMPGTATCGPFGEGGTYVTSSGQVIQGTRGPYSSQFDAITYQKTLGNSNYNALEINLRHQRGPLELLVGYTYGKSLDLSSSLAEPVNPVDPSLSKAISAFDMRQDFVASYEYDLPVDHLLHRRNRLTEGWNLTGITRFSSGFPVTLFNNNDTSLLGIIPNGINNNGVDTPNFAPGNLELNTNPRDGRPAFNTSLFSLPALGQMGTAARRFFYGPGIANSDLALLKNLHLTESKSLQFRVEAFNVANHAQFYGAAAVGGNISSPSFGRVLSAADPRLVQVAAKFYF